MYKVEPIVNYENQAQNLGFSGDLIQNSNQQSIGTFSFNFTFSNNFVLIDDSDSSDDEDIYYMPRPPLSPSKSKMPVKCLSRVNQNDRLNKNLDEVEYQGEEYDSDASDDCLSKSNYDSYFNKKPSKGKMHLNENSTPPSCESLPVVLKPTSKQELNLDIANDTEDSLSELSKQFSSQMIEKNKSSHHVSKIKSATSRHTRNENDDISKQSSTNSLVKQLAKNLENQLGKRNYSIQSLDLPKQQKSSILISDNTQSPHFIEIKRETSDPMVSPKASKSLIEPQKSASNISKIKSSAQIDQYLNDGSSNLTTSLSKNSLNKKSSYRNLNDINTKLESPPMILSDKQYLSNERDEFLKNMDSESKSDQIETGRLSTTESKSDDKISHTNSGSKETLNQTVYSIGSINNLKLMKNKDNDLNAKKTDENEDLEVTMKFAHGNGKVSESKFTLYNDETEKRYTSEYLPNLKADVRRKRLIDSNDDGTKVILRLYKTTQEHDGEAAKDKEEFLGKYELILHNDEKKKKYKFHDIGKENQITVKLSRNYPATWKKVVNKWNQ